MSIKLQLKYIFLSNFLEKCNNKKKINVERIMFFFLNVCYSIIREYIHFFWDE